MQNIVTSTSYYNPAGSAQDYGRHFESTGSHLESSGSHVDYQGRHLESPGHHLGPPSTGYLEMNNRGDFSSLSHKGTH